MPRDLFVGKQLQTPANYSQSSCGELIQSSFQTHPPVQDSKSRTCNHFLHQSPFINNTTDYHLFRSHSRLAQNCDALSLAAVHALASSLEMATLHTKQPLTNQLQPNDYHTSLREHLEIAPPSSYKGPLTSPLDTPQTVAHHFVPTQILHFDFCQPEQYVCCKGQGAKDHR